MTLVETVEEGEYLEWLSVLDRSTNRAAVICAREAKLMEHRSGRRSSGSAISTSQGRRARRVGDVGIGTVRATHADTLDERIVWIEDRLVGFRDGTLVSAEAGDSD
jgi:hypothetical protein